MLSKIDIEDFAKMNKDLYGVKMEYKKKLTKLSEWNEERISKILNMPFSGEVMFNGLMCPDCGGELSDTNPNSVIVSSPPRLQVNCVKCGFNGYRVI